MNSIAVIGRLTRDIELKQTQKSVVGNFSIADRKDADNTYFFDCVSWGKNAENMAKYLHKGSMVAVSGELRQREYTTKNGEKRKVVEINVEKFAFVEGAGGSKTAEEQRTEKKATPDGFEAYVSADEDLPF